MGGAPDKPFYMPVRNACGLSHMPRESVAWAKHTGAREVTARKREDWDESKLTEDGRQVNPLKKTFTPQLPREREES